MLNYFKKFCLLVFGFQIILLSSCKDDDEMNAEHKGAVKLVVNTMAGNQTYTRANVTTQSTLMRDYKITNYSFYINNFSLIKSDSTKVKIKDYLLYNYENADSSFALEASAGEYIGYTFDVGIDYSTNHSSPNQYDVNHPLGIGSDMHWSNSLGYLFLKIEGFSDTTAVGSPYIFKNFKYDMGLDALYRSYTKYTPIEVSHTGITSVQMYVDIHKFFTGSAGTVDIVNDNITHSTSSDFPIAKIIMDNFMQSIY